MEEIKQAKLKALQATLDRLDKSYGKGAVMRLGDDPSEALGVIQTGSISLVQKCTVNSFLSSIKVHNKKEQRLILNEAS